jgi:6-phosphogluconolactonase
MSPITLVRRDFLTGAELAPAFAEWTAARLREAIEARGAALLVVSGGVTPTRYFHALSSQPIDWSRVAITLADERRVADDDPRSNAKFVRETLLCGPAAAARFSPLADSRLDEDLELAAANARIAALPLPADLVALGMGEDGHTASWFPGAAGLAEAIDPGARAFVAPIRAPSAPEARLTLTGRVILRARAIALHIEGAAKQRALARALADGAVEAAPIRAVLRLAGERLTIFCAASS